MGNESSKNYRHRGSWKRRRADRSSESPINSCCTSTNFGCDDGCSTPGKRHCRHHGDCKDSQTFATSTQTDQKVPQSIADHSNLISAAPRLGRNCGFCNKPFDGDNISDIVIRPGERVRCCSVCFLNIHGPLQSVSFTPPANGNKENIQYQINPSRSLAQLMAASDPTNLAIQVLRMEQKLCQYDEKQAALESLRRSTEKRTLVITNALQRLDERLTTIHNLTLEKTSHPERAMEEKLEKCAADLRSLDVKTRSLDAKILVADRKRDLNENHVAALTENVRGIREQVNILEGKSKSQEEQIHDFSRRIVSAEESIRAANEKFLSFRSELEYIQEAIEKSDDKFDSLHATVQFNAKRTKEMETLFPAFQERISSVEEKVDVADGRLAARGVKVAEVTNKLADFESHFKATDEQLKKMEEKLAKISDLKAGLDDLTEKVRISQDNSRREELIEGCISPLRQNLRKVEQHILNVEREQIKLENQLARLVELQQQTTSRKVQFSHVHHSYGDLPLKKTKQYETEEKSDPSSPRTAVRQSDVSENVHAEESFSSDSSTEDALPPSSIASRPRSAPQKDALMPTRSFHSKTAPMQTHKTTNRALPEASSLENTIDVAVVPVSRPHTSPGLKKLKSALKTSSYSGFVPWDSAAGQKAAEEDNLPTTIPVQGDTPTRKSGFGSWLRDNNHSFKIPSMAKVEPTCVSKEPMRRSMSSLLMTRDGEDNVGSAGSESGDS
ncbi:hypothetical protein BV898_18103 [Hypsibius exemplaris]|uniref:Uncharacterized protein n=1 Tax=Hypsibius exemplaris TaxID=2072580 RepID=A0A9X6NGM0_HYPEX|nr:hypothetical protein BV898_18103 [Hypsibius exemplaris]